ncbi:hypothetical protein GCM10010441_52380 [Kitasatospora paracochleata]
MLGHILSADFVGAAALRSQLDRTEVVATWGVGSVSVDLRVRGLVQDPAPASTVLPVDARVHDRSGEYIGELLVWAEGGTTLWSVETVVVGCCCSAFSSMAGRAGPAPAPPRSQARCSDSLSYMPSNAEATRRRGDRATDLGEPRSWCPARGGTDPACQRADRLAR